MPNVIFSCPGCKNEMVRHVIELGVPYRSLCAKTGKIETMTATPISNKKRVLKRHPSAIAWSWSDGWEIFYRRYIGDGSVFMNETIGRGKTAALAWRDAARRYRKP